MTAALLWSVLSQVKGRGSVSWCRTGGAVSVIQRGVTKLSSASCPDRNLHSGMWDKGEGGKIHRLYPERIRVQCVKHYLYMQQLISPINSYVVLWQLWSDTFLSVWMLHLRMTILINCLRDLKTKAGRRYLLVTFDLFLDPFLHFSFQKAKRLLFLYLNMFL